MKLVDDQLKFIVAFAGADLNTYRPGDWANLRDDLEGFLWAESSQAKAGGEAYAFDGDETDGSDRKVRNLQAELRSLLKWCLRDREDTADTADLWAMKVSVRLTAFADGDVVTGLVIGSTIRDLVLFKSYQLLCNRSIRPIRLCAVCGRLFYRVRKQQYCQRACFMKAWVQTSKGRGLKKTADKKSAKKRRLANAKKKWAIGATPKKG